MTDEVPQGETFFGRYELTQRIAVGRTCDVFLAMSHGVEGFRRTVVVKRLKPELAANPEFVSRYLQQVRHHCSISHANVVQAIDLGEFDGRYFLTEEYVEGYDLLTLRDTASSGNLMLTAPLGLFIISEIVKGVEYSHRRLNPNTLQPMQLAHGDLHPRNIIVGFQGEVKIADVGVFRPLEEHDLESTEGLLRAFSYASPEMAKDELPTQKSDLFALGLLTVEMCAGTHPYSARTAEDVRKNAEKGRVAPDLIEAVPEPFRDMVTSLLRPDASERLVDLGVLYDRIISYLHSRHQQIGSRTVASFVSDVGDIELSTSVVYSGMLGSQIGSPALTTDPGLGRIEAVKVSELWGDEPVGPPSGELLTLRLPDGQAELLETNGREAEIDSLIEQASAVKAGSGRVVFVSGARGIGKSHLLRVAHAALSEKGFRAFLVTHDVDSAAHPYCTMLDLLGLMTTGKSLLWSKNAGVELTNALDKSGIGSPRDLQILRQILSLGEIPARAARKTVGKLVQQVVELDSAPLALFVDRADLADIMSLELIHGALSSFDTVPMLLVISSSNRGLLSQLGRAAPEDQRTTLVLQPLAEEAVTKLAAHVAGGPVANEAIRLSAGVPQLAVDQALRHRFSRPPSKRADRLDWLLLGLELLPAQIVSMLAIARAPIPTVALAELIGAEAGVVHRNCRRLASLHMIVENPVDCWSVGLRTVYDAVEHRITARESTHLGLKLAYRLTRHESAATRQRPTAARMFALAGRTETAIELGQAHADSLASVGFTDIALNYLGYLARVAEQEDFAQPRHVVRLRLQQVELGLNAHRLGRVRQILAHLSSKTEELRDEAAMIQVLAQQTRVSLRAGDSETTDATARRLSTAADVAVAPTALALASLALAEWHRQGGNLGRAKELLLRGHEALASFSPASSTLTDLCLVLVPVLLQCGDGQLARSLTASHSGPAKDLLVNQLNGLDALLQGDFEAATVPLERADAIALRTGRTDLCLHLAPPGVEAIIGMQRFDDAEKRITESTALAQRLDSRATEKSLEHLSHYLKVVRDPDSGTEHIFALREAFNEAIKQERLTEALTIGWLLASADSEPGTKSNTISRAVEIAQMTGDVAMATRLRNL